MTPNVPNPSRPPASPSTLLTVVIVNYDGWSDVLRLVASLAEEPEVGSGRAEVVVVDNATPGPIPVEMTVPRPGVRLISRRDNGGFAAGVNAGWRASMSPWLLVLNPDVVVPRGLLSRVTSRIEQIATDPDEAPGVVGFGLRNPNGTRQPSVGAFPSLARTVWEQLIPRSRRKYQAGWRTRPGPVDWVTGACVLVNTATLSDLGGMDEDFFLYYEEVALCRAARRLGWRVEFDSSVDVVHLHPLQNRPLQPMMRVITRHSKLLYFRKHLPHWQFVVLSWIVSAEAFLRTSWSETQGWVEDARAWRTIGEVTRRLRAGMELRGRDVLMLAEAATATVESPESRGFPNAVASARKR